jgi:hypothetical protein
MRAINVLALEAILAPGERWVGGVGILVGSGGRLLRETLEAVAGTGVGRGKAWRETLQ